jgi:hypothetical protein
MRNKTITRPNKIITRAQALRRMSAGADPNLFVNHANYHVKARAWVKLGKPLPSNPEERTKFLASIKVKA